MESSQPQPKPPFYEHRGFQGAVAVIGLLTAIWALVGAPKPWSVAKDLSESKLPLSNTAIVLDTSAAMAKPFGDGTKLEAATDAIAKFAASTNSSGLALRRTGGGCYDDGDVLVGFGGGHGDDVQEAASEARSGGVSNVINTVRGAIDEFTQEGFRKESSTRRVVVFMGGEDSCIEAAGEEISGALAGLGVDTTFRMYTLGLSQGEVENMKHFRAEIADYAKVEVVHVENKEELEEAVGQEAEEMAAGEVPNPDNLRTLSLELDVLEGAEEQDLEPTDPGETEVTTETGSPASIPGEGEIEVAPSEAESEVAPSGGEVEVAPSEESSAPPP